MKYFFCLIILCGALSCAVSKQGNLNCSKQYDYKSTTIDVKGISTKLKKDGVDFADIGVGQITIDPKNVQATERMQELDLLQYNICTQLRSLPNDSARQRLQEKYIETLLEMMQLSQKSASAVK